MKSADERFRDDLEAEYDRLITVVRDALESTKKVWAEIECKHCDRYGKYLVEVPNVKDSMEAAKFLADRGIGRPGTVEPGEREIVHEYKFEYVMPSGVGS